MRRKQLIQVTLLEPESEELDQLRIKHLKSEGEQNPELDEALPDEPRDYELPDIQDAKCQLCKIDKPVWNADEQIYFRDDDFYIVDTAGAEERGKKGHDVRNMSVLEEHGRMSSDSEMVERLIDITSSQIGDGYMVLYGSMQTFKEHQHIIASDIHGEDMAEINNYVLYDVEDGEPELVDYGSHDSIGGYIHEALGIR